MGYFITLRKILPSENQILYLLSILIAISCVYTKQLFSILLPIITVIIIKYQGKVSRLPILNILPLFILFLLLLLGGLSTVWSFVPLSSFKAFAGTAVSFVFAYFLFSALSEPHPELFKKVNKVLVLSVTILSSVFIYQTFVSVLNIKYLATFIEINNQLKPSGSIIGLAIFVVCAYSWINNEKLLAIFMFIILSMLVYLSLCQTAQYSLIFSLIVFGLSYMLPRWVTMMAAISSFLYMILAPLIFMYILPPSTILNSPLLNKVVNESLYHRFLGWEFYSFKIFDRPFLGWGAESSRHIQDNAELAKGFSNLLHPHNASIQAFVEMGLLGGLLISLLFPALFLLVLKKVKDPLSVAVCNSTLAFAFIAAEVTHNIWHSYWISWSCLVAGLVILFVKTREVQQRVPVGHLQPALSPSGV